MNNFLRAVRLALRYRLTVAATVCSSLLIAVLWGGNIGALYPIFEVSFSGKSTQEWTDDQISQAERTAEEISQQIDALEAQIAQAPQPSKDELRHKQRLLQSRLTAEQRVAARMRQLRPYLAQLPNDPFHMVLLLVALVMIGTILKDACIVAHMLLLARLTGQVSLDLQRQFFGHTMQMDAGTFGEKGTSAMMSHLGADIGSVSGGISTLFGNSLREPLKMLVCLVGAAFISWRLLLLSLVLAPISLLLVHRLARSIRRAVQRSLDTGLQLNRVLFEAFNGLQMVQAYTMEEQEKKRFRDISSQAYRKSMRIVFYNALVKPLTEMLGIGAVCLALIAGAYLVLNQETHLLGLPMTDRPLEWPSLLVFYGFLVGMSDPARKLSGILGAIQQGVAGADRLYPILDRRSRIVSPPDPRPLPRPIQDVQFRDVNFHYVAPNLVLEGINLQLKLGETIAIVGANGCGKSTLANLVPRFYDPVAGSVVIDGIDLRQVSLKDLRDRIAIVSQHSTLFDTTIMNNIRYGSVDASEAAVREAGRRAHAHSFISQLDDGYQSEVGQGGARLSGGQRQRVILARAILRNPEILILDEATNQIDPESELLIHKSIRQFIRGRLTFMITHRHSTLDLADRIVVMAEGRIVDVGTYSELQPRCDLFRRLCQSALRESA